MVLVNTDYISGKELTMLGLVKGSSVQCKNFGKDIGAGFKNLVGGELKAYTQMLEDAREGKLPEEGFEHGKLTEELFESYLDTAGIPDPDLLIRTSGEQRLSNYLLWQLAYTEFCFVDVPWPDFHEEELEYAIAQYNSRDRRYGGVKGE